MLGLVGGVKPSSPPHVVGVAGREFQGFPVPQGGSTAFATQLQAPRARSLVFRGNHPCFGGVFAILHTPEEGRIGSNTGVAQKLFLFPCPSVP